MVQRQQNVSEPVPPLFIRILLNLESSLNNAVASDAKKKMNASNARGLTAMKQKVKKALKEYVKEIKSYQAVSTCKASKISYLINSTGSGSVRT
jgi:translation initiation factor 3 subunit C